MSQYFASDSAFDVNQINWNWLYSFTNADGSSKFYDLNQVADIIDLSQFDEKALAQCTIDGKLLAIPVAMTGRNLLLGTRPPLRRPALRPRSRWKS